MRLKQKIVRVLAVLVLSASVLGAVQPSGLVRAAAPSQDVTEGWGTFELPEPVHVNLGWPTGVVPPETMQSPGPDADDLGSPAGQVGALSLSDLVVYANQAVGTGTSVASPLSPTAANDGKNMLAAYNEYAALSSNYGASWTEFDPWANDLLFDFLLDDGNFDGLHQGFSGHQEVLFDPSRNLTFWLIHFDPDDEGNNLQLAVTDSLAGFNWSFYQLLPDGFCTGGTGSSGDYFDQPRLVLTRNYIYILSEVYRKPGDTDRCSTIIRLSLDDLADGGSFNPGTFYFSSVDFNFTAAAGGTDTLFVASHSDADTFRIRWWPEAGLPSSIDCELPGLSQCQDVDHTAYTTGATYDCTVGDTGVNPCAALDDRITAAWLRRDLNKLGFMWTAPQDGSHNFPYIQTLVVDTDTANLPLSVLDDVATSDPDKALFLPSAAVNARGHVGGNYATAGGTATNEYPQCAVWLYDDYAGNAFVMDDATVVTSGTSNPGSDDWGKYFSTRMSGLNPFQWLGSCNAMEGGSPMPRVIRFGRERDTFLPRKSDFDGDSKSDPAKLLSNGQVWWKPSGAGFTGGVLIGTDGPYQRRSDFDGDGKADPAKFVVGAIWYISSRTGASIGKYLGSDGTMVVGSDFDRDGRTDPAKYVTAPGPGGGGSLWYLKSSTGTWVGTYIGADAAPVLPESDFDGDGRSDLAKYVAAAGAIWYRASSSGFWQGVFIGSDGTPIVGSDFDGDGITDMAKLLPSNTLWYRESSTSDWKGVFVGSGAYIAASDFDGDGKTDPAKFDTGTKGLFFLQSTTGTWGSAYMGGESYTVVN